MNAKVTEFLNELDHPLRNEIEVLRKLILCSRYPLAENIKWNAPNYSFAEQDRITMKIFPQKQIQLILHRGAKKLPMPVDRIIKHTSTLLSWKENDRAVLTLGGIREIEHHSDEIISIIDAWIEATV